MKKIYCLIFIVLNLQNNFCKPLVKGFILDSISKEAVSGAHIINCSTFKGTSTDSNGFFSIDALYEDSILIQTIEFQKKIVTIRDTLTQPFIILLSVQQYLIKEVKVGILGNYDQFKQMILNHDPNQDKFKIYGMKEPVYKAIPILEDKEYWDNSIIAFVHPISYIYYKYNKHAQSVFKYHENKKQQQEQLRADAKYNREIISRLTGLHDNEQITNFMLFCNFSHDYIMNTNEYNINQEILLKYDVYKKTLETK